MMGGMAGPYLIIDLGQQPPAIVDAGQVLPAAIADALAAIDAKMEKIMSDQAAEQAELNDLGTAMGVVADHVTAAGAANTTAISALQSYMQANAAQPLDFTPVTTALTALQAADASNQAAADTLAGIVPQTPATPLATPVADPGPPAPAPADPAVVDPSAPIDPGAPDPSV